MEKIQTPYNINHQLDSVFLQNIIWILCPQPWWLGIPCEQSSYQRCTPRNPIPICVPWTITVRNSEQYILEHLNTIQLSRSQYIAISIVKCGPYIDSMFALENFICTFCGQFINIINSNIPAKINQDILMPKHNQLLVDRYIDIVFPIREIQKQHQKFDHIRNHINHHPNLTNDSLWKKDMDFLSNLQFPLWPSWISRCKTT